jgi:hypothetical protein
VQRKPVESSHLRAVGYDPGSRKMHIEFHNGAVYEYKGVPEQFHKTLTEADSTGTFFHKNVKPHFDARRIN